MKEELPYLFWAYTSIWALISGYLGLLLSRQRALKRQIDEIKARLDREGAGRP